MSHTDTHASILLVIFPSEGTTAVIHFHKQSLPLLTLHSSLSPFLRLFGKQIGDLMNNRNVLPTVLKSVKSKIKVSVD